MFARILRRKRESFFSLLSLSSRCLKSVVWLFLGVPWVCLQFINVVFLDHTGFLFLLEHNLVKVPLDSLLMPRLIYSHATELTGKQACSDI